MSLLYNEYIVASNNSINENKYNTEKVSKTTSYKIKKILKPFLRMLKQNKKSQQQQHQQECNHYHHHEYPAQQQQSIEENDFWSSEIDDNSANEELESRIFHEIDECHMDAGVYVYNQQNECEVQPINREEKFIPVHFARTDAGTFFWTTVTKSADYDLVQPTFCYSDYQAPELQYGDRWVQA